MKGLAVALAATLLSITTLTEAQARVEPNPSTSDKEIAMSIYDPVVVKKGRDRICRRAREIDHNPGRCRRAVIRKTGMAKQVSGRMIAEQGHLRGLYTGMTLEEAAKIPAPVYCKVWTEWMRGLYYVNWKEVHKGKFCYNGSDVWISKSMGGWHKCDLGYGFGYDIVVKDCSENLLYVDTVPGYGYQNWDRFRAHVAWKGIPLWATHEMHANVYPSGNVHYY
jgi:hypothetical protein